MTQIEALLEIVCSELSRVVDKRRISNAKRRMAGVFSKNDIDYLPMVAIRKEVSALQDLPEFDWAQQWHDPAKSLYMQIKNNVLPLADGGGDYVPFVRPDTGVINCPSLFGIDYAVPEHTKPVVTSVLQKEVIPKIVIPDDISGMGIMPHLRRHIEHHKVALRERGLEDRVLIGHCDLQGPFDIAALVRGHEIFTDFYEDPDFVHTLMELSTNAFIAVAKFCKQISSEPLNHGISDAIYMENGLGRMCGDTDILVSSKLHEEFIRPYQEKALAPFGGGWLHYCGGCTGFNRPEGLHLHSSYAQIANLHGLNWTTAHDYLAEMKRLKEMNLTYIGYIPRRQGQSLEDYFRMALTPYDKRADFIFGWPELERHETDMAMDLWHKVQESVFR